MRTILTTYIMHPFEFTKAKTNENPTFEILIGVGGGGGGTRL